jgi:hypothetical protein
MFHRGASKKLTTLRVRDPELVEIAELALQRTRNADQSLEEVFERVRPILYRKVEQTTTVRNAELPALLKQKIMTIPDPEQRVRAMVDFRMSRRTRRMDKG